MAAHRFYLGLVATPGGFPIGVAGAPGYWDVGTSGQHYLQGAKAGATAESPRSKVLTGAPPRRESGIHILVSDSGALPVGTLAGSFRWVTSYRSHSGVRPSVRLSVVSADATVRRGYLFTGEPDIAGFTEPTGSGESARTVIALTGELTPVDVQAGDRLLVERGWYYATGNAFQKSGTFWDTSRADHPDLTLAQVGTTTTAGVPWLEVIASEPAQAPTELAAVPGPNAVALTWGNPAAGPDPTGYELRVDGGPAVDVGDVLAWTLEGLASSTTYLVEVRAYAPGGASAWVALGVTTLAGARYRAVVRLGDHTWDVLAGAPPQLGPVLPLSFGWAVPEDSWGFPAQPVPSTAQLELVTATAADMAGVDIGTPARVSIFTSSDPAARPWATFAGRVADLEAEPDSRGLRWRVLAVDYTADLSGLQVGTAEWPEESGDARLARIAAEAGLPGWAADPVGCVFMARGPGATTAKAALDESVAAAVTAEGTPYGPSRRVLVHPNLDADAELDPAAPFGASEVLRRVDHIDVVDAGLVNRRTTWRRTRLLDAEWVRIDHPGGPTTYGDTRGPAYPPLTVPITDPTELADMILDTTPGYRWLTGDALRLELWADEAAAHPLEWFYRDPVSHPFPWSGRAVVVQGIAQAPDGSTSYAGMLSAARLVLDPKGKLAVEFRLRPEVPADSTVTMRWMDEPPGASWADELADDPTGTWFDYRTTPRPA